MSTRLDRHPFLAAVVVLIAVAGCGAAEPSSSRAPAPPSPAVAHASTASIQPSVAPTASAPSTPVDHPLASSDGWIIDQTGKPGGGAVIRLTRTDGGGRHIVATEAPGRYHYHPEWSADGGAFTYLTTDADDGSRSIWIHDVGADTSRVLVDCTDPCIDAAEQAESPDGAQVAYYFADGPNVDVVVDGETLPIPTTCGLRTVTIATLAIETITSESCAVVEERFPRWAPSGDRLAYLRTHAATTAGPITKTDLVIRDLATGGESVVASGPGEAFAMFDWSPDGSRLVVTAGDGLRLVAVDGTGVTDLVRPDPMGATHPRYTSDGSQVLFFRTTWSPSGEAIGRSLWTVPASGGEPVPVLPVAPPGGNEGHTTWGSLQPGQTGS